MIKSFALGLSLSVLATAASAQMISEYTEYDADADCAVVARSSGEGDWADFVCAGFANYPFAISYSDGREAVTYGFATEPGMPTFGPFNYANGRIEWRVRLEGQTERPMAAIQRWYLADQNGEWANEILVVSRVGQPNAGGACVMAYVDAAEAGGNERARQLADQMVGNFTCGDAPTVEAGIEEFVPPS
ncbi:hypothetical protein [Pelagibacterium luteolum]|uniref:Uncharacterized protein n=1 Tax=Pelagibacterium luteolum TaxID=440168 RepID=A0A1G7WRZ3_9HYPH|nr:hypothetical protein [Pelagibacterium luteolum]SDG74737.1 hypothetical protein SAMN04487974_10781 [Pelagibacterium luteolum]